MEVKKRLLMTFKTDEDKRVSIAVDDPRANVTEADIVAAMNVILEKDVFVPNGEALVALVDAKVVETGTVEYDLVF